MTPRQRLEQVDWPALEQHLDDQGHAVIPGLLDAGECTGLAALYAETDRFRSRVVMARHGFGRGEYQYFAYPLPTLVDTLRQDLYSRLVPIANRWQARLGKARRFPAQHRAYLAQCHDGGQCRPTPLLLRYRPGDYNCLHQDLYGENWFPLQVAVLLSAPGEQFEGGEFVLTEQRPRRQSRAMVPPLRQGDALVFAVNQRPVAGQRGDYRVTLRHGVSELRRGERYTLGLIFHDAA
ncbi:hypothetical protein SAMN05877962_10244 [Alloalcanivorax xenomutans]|uniref:2OG-Fe(II) oxygenase n=1 Tax=Alloalcanivorax xenomutans TaxID=1094342 RepID=UPI000BD5452A|nr:2OG-Fe(II) oxygenase [Alloalcanivorax xenomutans]SOB95438.1 hypothetical protein SAMN05877962_10244 [Alloalcanivorax xenomutans]